MRTDTLLVPFGLEGDVSMSITCSLFVSSFTIISNMDVPKIYLVKIIEGDVHLLFLYSMRCEKHHHDHLGTHTKKACTKSWVQRGHLFLKADLKKLYNTIKKMNKVTMTTP